MSNLIINDSGEWTKVNYWYRVDTVGRNPLENMMKTLRRITISAALFAAMALPTIANAGGPGQPPPPPPPPPSNSGGSSGTHGVPGPLAGAGLPFIAVGYGVYWLIRRRRKA